MKTMFALLILLSVATLNCKDEESVYVCTDKGCDWIFVYR